MKYLPELGAIRWGKIIQHWPIVRPQRQKETKAFKTLSQNYELHYKIAFERRGDRQTD